AAGRRAAGPDRATTRPWAPLDERRALPHQLGRRPAVARLPVPRPRAGLPDPLRLRPRAALPVVDQPALSGGAGALVREPALLLQRGWAPAQIRAGDNGRPRHPAGRPPGSLPGHPDVLRDELRG